MSGPLYYIHELVDGVLTHTETWTPVLDGKHLGQLEIRIIDEGWGERPVEGIFSTKKIPNPFYERETPFKIKVFGGIIGLIVAVILLVSCLLYIRLSPVLSDGALITFYVFGISLSLYNVLFLADNSGADNLSRKILLFFLSTLNFTCSVLLYYFSEITLDKNEGTQKTLIICVVLIVVYAILKILFLYGYTTPERKEITNPKSKQIWDQNNGSVPANRIE